MPVKDMLLAALAIAPLAVSAHPVMNWMPGSKGSVELTKVEESAQQEDSDRVNLQAATQLTIYNYMPTTGAATVTWTATGQSAVTFSNIAQGGNAQQNVEAETAAAVTVSVGGSQVASTNTDGSQPCQTSLDFLNTGFLGADTQTIGTTGVVRAGIPYLIGSTCTMAANQMRIFQMNEAGNFGNYYYSDLKDANTAFADVGTTYFLSHNGIYAADVANTAATTYVSWVSFIPSDTSASNVCKKCTFTMTGSGQSAVYGFAYSTSWTAQSTDIGSIQTGSGVTVSCVTTTECITAASGSSSSSSSSSSNPCFHGDEKLYLQDGTEKNIEDAKIGDRVLVAKKTGETTFAPIVYIPHEKNTQDSKFIKLTTRHRSVKATPNHLIRAAHCTEKAKQLDQKIEFYPAKLVTIGMCVETIEGLEPVTGIEESDEQGIYTIVTADWDGIVVVNGVRASSFAYDHSYVNTYYHFHRVMYNFMPSWFMHSKAAVGINNMVGELASWLFL